MKRRGLRREHSIWDFVKETENRVKETAGKSEEFGTTENKEEENFKEGVENNVNAADKTS